MNDKLNQDNLKNPNQDNTPKCNNGASLDTDKSLLKNPEDKKLQEEAIRIGIKPDKFKKRIDWRIVQMKVREKFIELLERDETLIPDALTIARELQIDYRTAKVHLESMHFENCRKELKPLSFLHMQNLSRLAKDKGSYAVAASKLFEQMVNNFSETNTQIHYEMSAVLSLMDDVIGEINATEIPEKVKQELLQRVLAKVEKLNLDKDKPDGEKQAA